MSKLVIDKNKLEDIVLEKQLILKMPAATILHIFRNHHIDIRPFIDDELSKENLKKLLIEAIY